MKEGFVHGSDVPAALRCSDDVGSGLFNHSKALEFQLTNDRCLARTGRTRDDESFHELVLFRTLLGSHVVQ